VKRKPKFGQNFLVDRAWQKRIVEAFRPDAAFAEIGYGEGALTNLLLERFKFFVVFEIDESLIAKANLSHEFKMIHLDFLKWDFHLNDQRVENFSLISNLPYESSTAILLRVIERADQIEHFVFMFQREVADRILARPKSRTYGALSVLAQGQYQLESLGILKPGAFKPPPKVDSTVIRAFRRKDPHPREEVYRNFIFKAFSQKRKILKNALKQEFLAEKIQQVFSSLGLSDNIRAEEIGLEDWPKLFYKFYER